MNQTVNRLRDDRDRVLHTITEATDSTNFVVLYTLVQTLTRSISHIIVTAEKENRNVTPYEQGHIDAWVTTLKSIAKNLDAFTTGRS